MKTRHQTTRHRGGRPFAYPVQVGGFGGRNGKSTQLPTTARRAFLLFFLLFLFFFFQCVVFSSSSEKWFQENGARTQIPCPTSWTVSCAASCTNSSRNRR